MGSWHGAQFLLREVLIRLGVLVPPPASQSLLRSAAASAWHLLPDTIRERLRPLRQRLAPDPPRPRPGLGADTRRSRAFVVPNGMPVGGIRLNLAGREPEGPIAPGPEAEACLETLIRQLQAIVDERAGRPAFREVVRTRDRHAGPHLNRLPDLLVYWSEEPATGSSLLAHGAGARVRLTSPDIGVVEGINDYGRTGEHRPEGLYVLAGPGVTPGEAPGVPVTGLGAMIVDLLR